MLASSSKKPWFRFTVTAMQFFTVLYICLIASDSDIFFLHVPIMKCVYGIQWMRVRCIKRHPCPETHCPFPGTRYSSCPVAGE